MNDIRCLVLDVDGVLTDGRLYYGDGPADEPLRAFDIHDGMGIQLFRRTLGEVVICTAKSSRAVTRRAADLGLRHVIQGSTDKAADLERLLPALDVAWSQVAAMGDDLPDLAVLQRCGYPLAPADAVPEVRSAARYVAQRPGGRGAVREAIEHLLRSAGRWDSLVAGYAAATADRA